MSTPINSDTVSEKRSGLELQNERIEENLGEGLENLYDALDAGDFDAAFEMFEDRDICEFI